MIVTTLATGDLLTAIPSLWEDAKMPLAVLTLMVGAAAGAFSLVKGFGAAAGKVIGGVALGAIILGAVGLMSSTKDTIDRHGGGITSGSFGR
ncbi:hypothetical protein KIH27_20290 [Mycobacterium sp. M1]|uniref:Uncharacterized protein n=1 Tax=Mycolicibacter acidiphilus TaxID=2835306 RepID=A0ABS5RQY8_9MYCO|nr:hypothetical protein [Mycolicibacter acidiphilus]MBS9535926.1 hypothetical protein [Mycolicibacter acidiphilus]